MKDNEGVVIDAAVSEAKPPMAVRDHRASQLAERAPAGAIDTSPPAVIARMLQSGVGLADMKAMLELQRDWEKDQARKAYAAAMARFKADPPTIDKDKHVSFRLKEGGQVDYHHATIGNVVGKIVAGLAREGLAHRWSIEQADQITVTCTITHEQGHSESVTMKAGRDDSGKKNAIQQVASTITYLQRYTLLAATGLATSDQTDDDGGGDDDDPGAPEQRGGADKSPYDDGAFKRNLPAWRELVATGKKTPAAILASLESKALLLDSQRKSIRELGGAK